MEIPKGALAPPVKVGLRHDFGVDRNSLPIFYDNLPVGTKIDYPRGTQDSAVVRGGFSFTPTGGINASVQYAAELGASRNNLGVMGQYAFPFRCSVKPRKSFLPYKGVRTTRVRPLEEGPHGSGPFVRCPPGSRRTAAITGPSWATKTPTYCHGHRLQLRSLLVRAEILKQGTKSCLKH